MMEYLAWAAVAYLAVRLLIIMINLITRPVLQPGVPSSFPFVSILIPARDEEGSIGLLLEDLRHLDYPSFEVIVCDDDSQDRTAAIIQSFSQLDQRFFYLKGKPLPEGWLGKHFACHQLALRANGKFLLFLDADVRVNPGLVKDAVACREKYGLHLLSIFPGQKMNSVGEKLTVPLMHWILVSNLPLLLIRKIKASSFAAASGNFMLFDASVYRAEWLHKTIRTARTDDIAIIKKMKDLGYKTCTLLARDQIKCRMYSDLKSSLIGFTRNVNAFFGNSWMILLLYAIITTFGPLAVLLTLHPILSFFFFAGLILARILVSIQSRQDWLMNIVLMPFQQLAFFSIVILAIISQTTGVLIWKRRNIRKVGDNG